MERLNQVAAAVARDAIQKAILHLESGIQGEPPKGPHEDYFTAQMRERKEAIGQLQSFGADLSKRAFDAYQERK